MTESLDVWTFADQFRPMVKALSNVNQRRPILTGMTLGLNSTLMISEGSKKLPPCPILLFSTNEGVIQVYYFIHKTLPSIVRTPEMIKPAPTSAPAANGFSFNMTTNQPKGTTDLPSLTFNNQPTQAKVTPGIDLISAAIGATGFNTSTPVPQTPVESKTVTTNVQSSANDKKVLQMIDEFQSKLKSLQRHISTSPQASVNLDQSLAELKATLDRMATSLRTSIESIKRMTSEHIQSMTKIENAHHQIKLCQKENLYHFLKDRELDPWTQTRLDSIQTKYEQLKHRLDVLIQLTHTTFHDKSSSINGDGAENEDFVPDLEISLNTHETWTHRIQKRILELSHKVTETEQDLEMICSKLNSDLLGSSTFIKTTMSSPRPSRASDAQILSYLQTNHPKVQQIQVPSAPVINFSSTNEQKKQSTIETTKAIPPIIQPATPKQTDLPTVELEGYKNMLRLIRTSIDLFSGVTSPEQLQELSNTIATSPFSSTHKSNMTSSERTPTIPKTTNLPRTTTTVTRAPQATPPPTNILQTPARSVASAIPTISVTPPTPASQAVPVDTALKLQPNKSFGQTATDLTKSQSSSSSSGDNTIRSLLNNTVAPPTTITPSPGQPVTSAAPIQIPKPAVFGNPPSTSAAQVIITTTTTVPPSVGSIPAPVQSAFGAPHPPVATAVTSVQSTSPTTRPIMSTGFGARPMFGGTAFNTPSTSSSLSFGGSTATANTGTLFGSTATSTTPSSTPFGGGFGAGATAITTPTTSVPTATTFGTPTSAVSGPFGSGFGISPAATTSAPTAGIFGASPATTTSATTAGVFGAPPATTTSAPTSSIFGSPATSPISPFGSGFVSAPPTAMTSAPSTGFGSGFGASPAITSPLGGSFGGAGITCSTGSFGASPSMSTGSPFTGFGVTASSAPTSTGSTSLFGGGGTSTFGSRFSGFGTQSQSSGQPSSFSFGGFGPQSSDITASTPTSFTSFGPTPAGAQATSPFGGSSFGGAGGQSPGFGGATSSFGASATQTASSPSFTNYRK